MTTSASKQDTTPPRAMPPSAEVDLPLEPSGASVQPQRQAMIAEAAFFMAQSRGFVPGQELDDWLAAERAVDQRPPATEH
ncbi:MAG: DUF2934 domain-containing protein [Rubrivivax sp.]|nr:DUF2934 domain-containing protein [Rubrivivax sp.]